MRYLFRTLFSILAFTVFPVALRAQAALMTDPPADKVYPAAMQTVQIPSHGVLLNGLVYVAAGAGPHPVVVLLHGFPGNEKNLDLAQAIRRAGWDVVFFNYRGSWGTPGAFLFTHAMEDAQAVLAWVREPGTAGKLRADPKLLVLVGHSMGGMIAAHVAAEDTGVSAVGLISAADMAGRLLPAVLRARERKQLRRPQSRLRRRGWHRWRDVRRRAWLVTSWRMRRGGACRRRRRSWPRVPCWW